MLLPTSLWAQPDSAAFDSAMVLGEVTVRALGGYRADAASPVPFAKLDAQALAEPSGTTLVPAMNRLAGVRLEERAPASYRVSIRGSSLRAPFGVRNVKVYWNGIPFTEPNNTTALNLLDLGQVDQITVLKGPTGSGYGAGTGGTILLNTLPAYSPGWGSQVRYTAGSWGTHHARAELNWANQDTRISVKGQHLQSAGYRDHSAVRRTGGQAQIHHTTKQGLLLRGHLLYTDLDYQIPGGITAEQLAENPRQARPRSASQNSSVVQRRGLVGLNLQEKQGPLRHHTVVYGYLGDFANPFILDYKQETNQGAGLRNAIQYTLREGLELELGGEYQWAFDRAENFGNVDGVRDTLRFADDITTQQGFLFATATYTPRPAWRITGGLSTNAYRYAVVRTASALSPTDTGRFVRNFRPVLAPQIGLSYAPGPWVAHASVRYGFSPPTLDEVRTNEGSLNADLKAEEGINYEVGLRWNADGQERLALNLFYFQLRETIGTYTNPDGVVLFRNAGRTRQWGVELQGTERWQASPTLRIQYRYAYTGHFFRYQQYQTGGDDYSGNALPGVPPHTLAHSLQATYRQRVQLYVQHIWSAGLPLNDANTAYAQPYHWLNAKLSYRQPWNKVLGEVFLGVDNLLNATYSLGNDLNAFGQRYYQPAPGRTFLVGITVDVTN